MNMQNWLGTRSINTEGDIWLFIQVPGCEYNIFDARTIVHYFAEITGNPCGFIQQDPDSDRFHLLAKTGGELPKQFTSVAEWHPIEELTGAIDFPFVYHSIEMAPDVFMQTLVHRDKV